MIYKSQKQSDKNRRTEKCNTGWLWVILQGDYVKRETQRRLDEETMKFIRMKRPRLQCKESGGCLVAPARSRSSQFRWGRYLVAPARLMRCALVTTWSFKQDRCRSRGGHYLVARARSMSTA